MRLSEQTRKDIDRAFKALDAIEQIRQEIEDCIDGRCHIDEWESGYQRAMNDALDIIDKYMKESSDAENSM